MITFVLAPIAATTPILPSVNAMLQGKQLAAYVVRDNNRLRRMILLPLGGTERETAEWIYDQVEDGRTPKAVAREIHVSVATVRRFLLSLELTEEIEGGEWDGYWADLHGFAYEAPADEMSEEELAAVFASDSVEVPETPAACSDDTLAADQPQLHS